MGTETRPVLGSRVRIREGRWMGEDGFVIKTADRHCYVLLDASRSLHMFPWEYVTNREDPSPSVYSEVPCLG